MPLNPDQVTTVIKPAFNKREVPTSHPVHKKLNNGKFHSDRA